MNRATNRRRLTAHIPAELNGAWDQEIWPGTSVEIAFNGGYRVIDMQPIDDEYVPTA
jgi:hypothetical protein